jgi:nucleoside-diphosphate-sugar epimerase
MPGQVNGRHLLVTGAGGFVGTALVRRAAARGANVTAVVRPGSTRAGSLDGATAIVGVDLTDAASLRETVNALRPDVCVHLAAAGAVVAEADVEQLLITNAVVPGLLAQTLAGCGCTRLVCAGSSSEYGPCDQAMSETRPLAPDDIYGAAKAAGGLISQAAGRAYGIDVVHLRLFSVYGPGEDERRLVAGVIRSLLAGRPLDLTAGEQVRDFVYVDDVADAFIAAACIPGLAGETINVGSGRETSVRELCELVASLVGADPRLLRFGVRPYRPNERFSWRADTDAAARLLGWRAETSLLDGLARTVAAARGGAVRRAEAV